MNLQNITERSMKTTLCSIVSVASIFLGVTLCFGQTTSTKFTNGVTVAGAYHHFFDKKEIKFNFTTEVGSVVITTSSGVQQSIPIEPQLIHHKKNPEIFYCYSQSFQLSIDDTLSMNLDVSGTYYAKNLKSPNSPNGGMLSVVVSLVPDSENQEDFPLTYALFPPTFATLSTLAKIHFDFKNQDSTVKFNEQKNILIRARSNSKFTDKQVKIKLRILATGMNDADLKTNNAIIDDRVIEQAKID